jgi:hypothetical protein
LVHKKEGIEVSGNKRSKSKFPALNKGLNLKSRKDYIEPDYINGVKNADGETVIRPLTEGEKKFLNDFYAETVITDFLHDPRLKGLLKKKQKLINSADIKELQIEIKALKQSKNDNTKRIQELKDIIKLLKERNIEENEDEINLINKKMDSIRKEVLLYPDKESHKKFYNDNNSRNSCIYNRSVMMNKLTYIDHEDYNKFSESYDALNNDYENYLIDMLEREKYELEEERLMELLKEEAAIKKKS